MRINFYQKSFMFLVTTTLLIGCGAKDNLVEGITPKTSSGSRSALGASGPTIAGRKGDTLIASYSTLFLQKLVETAKLVSFVEQAETTVVDDGCSHISKDTVTLNPKKDILQISYYSDQGSGECSDRKKIGKQVFTTALDSSSEETFVVKMNKKGAIKSILLRKNEQNVKLQLGIERAPKKYVDGTVELARSFKAIRTGAAECTGFDRCYKVKSRLLLDVNNIVFSPSKNSAVKFKERDAKYDFRFDFIVKFSATKQVIIPTSGKNNLFIKGERMPFNKDRGFFYQGKLALKSTSAELELNQSATGNCGYFVTGEANFFFKWAKRLSMLRSMERFLDTKVTFKSDKIVTTVLKNRGTEKLLDIELDRNSCSNIAASSLGPFFNLYSLFSY